MRVAARVSSVLLVVLAGCGSEQSSQKDAAAPDHPGDDARWPDSGLWQRPDLVGPPDWPSFLDGNDPAEAGAGPDLALDLGARDVAIDPVPRLDLVAGPDAADARPDAADARPDLAAVPDAPAKDDLPVRTDTPPDVVSARDVRRDSAKRDVPILLDSTADGAGIDGEGIDGGQPDVPVVLSDRTLGGCPILPANHIFNTPIADLPVHASSAAFMATIGDHNLHLDLGTTTDMSSSEYWGIPYNVVSGNAMGWASVRYSSADPELSWDPRDESDCVDMSSAAEHTVVSPCLAESATMPWLPIPTSPLVEGGIVTDPTQPYGDHHMLIIDSDTCRLWELYHCYPNAANGWDIFGSATWDLRSNALRTAEWSSADAAGFPILPLLLLASEASSGEIKHALRFTIESSSIRKEYIWPARHLTSNGTTSPDLPPMGQLFRLKASYEIPSSYGTQSRAILQALKTYGMYIADGGSSMYIQGDPNADWQERTFSEVQSVGSNEFEAVDLSPIMARAGFDPSSAAVPAP